MQLTINRSKLVQLAVITCSFVIAWYSSSFDVTELVYVQPANSVWTSLSHDLKLDHKANSKLVQAEIHKLLADQNKLNSILQAAGPYIYYVYQQTQKRGLPAELALIPVIESEYNPNDHSNKGATGLWQLMPETAHELGIKIKSRYDGRRNVVASTKAALAYFNDLGNMFKGNWYLAIAAYNCGQVKVASAERNTGSHSFWNLPLPRETKDYVPKLLAVAAIIKNPEKYGIKLPSVTNAPYFATVQVRTPMSLVQVAKSSGISIETLHALNPDYNHGVVVIADVKKAATLLVPANKESAVRARFADKIV